MSWLASFLVALLTAAVGLVLGGFIASHAVSWYRISSFEGGSGYFVVGMALLGFVAALVIGLVASRIVAASAHPGVWRAIGWSQLTVVGIAAIIAGIARFSADVAPKLEWRGDAARGGDPVAGDADDVAGDGHDAAPAQALLEPQPRRAHESRRRALDGGRAPGGRPMGRAGRRRRVHEPR